MKKVRPALLKGFDQEYLPQEQLQFNELVDAIRRTFELYGFLPIETPSAELKEILTSKGGVEKEIYGLSRLAASPGDETSGRGALRFDLTVPLARYVAMREHDLVFPFRRYQIQRVWRGENPQAKRGRFREFYQCDIDIINRNKLSYLAEAEIPSVIYTLFKKIAIGGFRIRISNRKILRGFLKNFGVPDQNSAVVLRALDKIDKVDRAATLEGLAQEGVSTRVAKELYSLVSTKRGTSETLRDLEGRDAYNNEIYQQGLKELNSIVSAIHDFGVPDSAFCVDLGVVRGLDYYTGTIYETSLDSYPELGSICSGGRYDNLASYFTDTKLPGVGISIGLTRLFSALREAGILRQPMKTPAEVLVTTMDHQFLTRYLALAATLRGADINTETYLEPAKLRDQLAYAERKGFRLAIIAGESEFDTNTVQVKNLSTKTATNHPMDQLVAVVKGFQRLLEVERS